jgi:electron transfer flavoprotein beta subunit
MSNPLHIVVCGGLVPDPLQTLEPITGPTGPALKNEAMLPAILDPWAASALYEAAALAKANAESKVYLVCAAPKGKLQQVMMALAQKAPFELVPVDAPAGGFTDSAECAALLTDAIQSIPGLDRANMLLFGGWESASRGAGATLAMLGEKLGLTEQFQGVDKLTLNADGSMEILERVENGKHQVSTLAAPPAVVGWATGSLAEPPNNPQVGMANMKTLMPSLQKAKAGKFNSEGLSFQSVVLPKQKRDTKVVKDMPVEQIAKEIVEWIKTK